METSIEEGEESDHSSEALQCAPAGDLSERSEGKRDHEKAKRPGARLIRDIIQRIRAQIVLEEIPDEQREREKA